MNPFDRIKAYIKGKYNYELGFTGALMLLELERLMDEAKQNLDVAAAKIDQSHQPLQTNDPKAAFWFGIGSSGVWVLPVVLAISVISWFYAQQSDFRDIIPVVRKYPNAAQFQFLMQHGTLKRESNGNLNLVLYPASKGDNLQVGLNYRYDTECNCIYVPLFFKP